MCWPLRFLRRELGKPRIVHRNVLLDVVDLDREPSSGPSQGPAVWNFHSVGVAIIRIIDLRREQPASLHFAFINLPSLQTLNDLDLLGVSQRSQRCKIFQLIPVQGSAQAPQGRLL